MQVHKNMDTHTHTHTHCVCWCMSAQVRCHPPVLAYQADSTARPYTHVRTYTHKHTQTHMNTHTLDAQVCV